MLRDFIRDLRHGMRLLRRSPGFAFVATSTLALAIGATVCVFSIVDAWLFKPLNFPRADQLLVAFAARPETPTEPAVFLPYRAYLGWKARARFVTSVSAAFVREVTLTHDVEAHTLLGLSVSPEFFDTLGVPPLLGRTLSETDVHGQPTVVISHGLWQRQFGASRDVVGSAITLSNVPHVVVGVMPPEFETRVLDMAFEFWTPLRPDQPGYQPGGTGPVTIIARLRDGVSLDAARREAASLTRELESGYTRNYNTFVANVTPMQVDNTRTVRATLLTVSAGVVCLLLIAAINVGTLLLGRGLQRMREAAIRAAIGSGRGRLVRQFVTESFVIAWIGTVAGLLVAHTATRLFSAWNPLGTLPANAIEFDIRVAAVTLSVLILVTLLCGLVPALRISHAHPHETLRLSGGRGVEASAQRTQLTMLAVQMAACVVLVAAAALLTRTFVRLQAEPLGFDPSDLQVANVVLPTQAFDSGDARYAFYRHLADGLRTHPGVRAVALSSSRPLNSGVPAAVYLGPADTPDAPRISVQDVSSEFFAALTIPLLTGRVFDSRDSRDGARVAIVNERAARLLFGDLSAAIGGRIRLDDEASREIVGIVGGVRGTFFNTLEWTNDPIVYRPAAQGLNRPPNPTLTAVTFQLHIRSEDPLTLRSVRDAAAAVNSAAAVTDLQPVSDLVASATRQPTFRMALLLAFGGITVALTALGVYGTVSQAVTSRRREFAIRIALGAEPIALVTSSMWRVVVTAAAGLVAGGAGAILATSWLKALLYGVSPHDALSLSLSTAVLVSVVAVAAFVPARRAARVDPMNALRAD